jgi:predicted dehydrogenase
MKKSIRIGIVGYAKFGQGMARTFSAIDGIEIAGVFNRGAERRQQAEADGYRAFDDYAELLALPGLDGVAIATANCVHAEQCIQAAEAGKHIFCEKPLALDMESFDRVSEACRRAGVVTHLDFTMRFGGAQRKLIELAHGGRLGRTLTLWVRRCRGYGLWAAGKRHPDIVHPEISGGWNIHHNVHGTDLLLHLAQDRVVEVYCKQARSAEEVPCEEIILAIVTFAGGAIGYVGDSMSIQREDYAGIIGDKGSVVLRHGGEFVIKMENGTETKESVDEEKGLAASCRAFVDACRGTGNGNIPFEQGRHSLEVLLAMNQSASEGRIIRLDDGNVQE